MGDDQHGHAGGGQALHDGEHLPHHFGVQGAGGFVKEQDLRLHAQGAGNGHALFLSAGKLSGPGLAIGRHAHLFQILKGPLLGLGALDLQDLHLAQHAVFQYGQIAKEVEALEHHAHLAVIQGALPAGGGVLAVVKDLAARGLLQEIDAAKQGAFARAGGADDADHVAGLHAEIDIPQHAVIAKALFQMVDLQDLRHVHASSAGMVISLWLSLWEP